MEGPNKGTLIFLWGSCQYGTYMAVSSNIIVVHSIGEPVRYRPQLAGAGAQVEVAKRTGKPINLMQR